MISYFFDQIRTTVTISTHKYNVWRLISYLYRTHHHHIVLFQCPMKSRPASSNSNKSESVQCGPRLQSCWVCSMVCLGLPQRHSLVSERPHFRRLLPVLPTLHRARFNAIHSFLGTSVPLANFSVGAWIA